MLVANSATGHDHAHVVKSAVRTLEIFEFFDEVRHPVNVVTVSEALGYPQSSTAALLRSLVAMGYLQFDSRARTYMPTDRVSLLGSWISPPLFEEASLTRLARAIAARTGQLVLVAARNGDFAQYVHVLNTPGAVGHHIRIGMKRQLATSGVGLVLLAAMGDAEVRKLYHRMNAYASSRDEMVNVPELLEQLVAVRRKGYALSKNRVVEGYGMIAVRLPKECTTRPLVIGIGGLCDTLESREAELVQAARQEMATHIRNQPAESRTEPSRTSVAEGARPAFTVITRSNLESRVNHSAA